MSGAELKILLLENGFVLAEIARGLGISPQALNSKFDARSLKVDFIKDIEKEIKKSIDELPTSPTTTTNDRPPGKVLNLPDPWDVNDYRQWIYSQKRAVGATLLDDLVSRHLAHTVAYLLISEKRVDLDETREIRVSAALKDTELYLRKRFTE